MNELLMSIWTPIRRTASKWLPVLFPTGRYETIIDRRRAAAVYAFSVLVFAAGVFFTVSLLAGGQFGRSTLTTRVLIYMIGTAISIYYTQRGVLLNGALSLLATLFVPDFLDAAYTPGNLNIIYSNMFLFITATGLLVGERGVLYATIGFLTAITALAFPRDDTRQQLIAIYFPTLSVHGAVSYFLARNIGTVARQAVASADQQRMQLIEATGLISNRLLGTRLDLQQLVRDTVNLVRDTFPFVDEVQIFLIDKERRNAELSATTAFTNAISVGQQVGVGSLSVIGRVTISGQAILVRESSEEQAYRKSAFLEGTRAQFAIPLRVGNETIGALDLQSHTDSAFNENNMRTLEALANQVAVAIDNARLYEESQKQLVENKRLYEQTRSNLREIERLNRQLTGAAWSEYLETSAQIPAYTVDLVTGQSMMGADWTPTMVEASRLNRVNVKTVGQARMLTIPLSVRGQTIGAMEFELPLDQAVTQEQINILGQVVERIGLAVENARLLDEAQRLAQREAMVNEISARMQTTTGVDAVLSAATQSIAEALQAPRVAVRLGDPSAQAR
jgi:GAF domain-containing protein